MKNMKRLIAAACALTLALSLCACGGSGSASSGKTPASSTPSGTTSTPAGTASTPAASSTPAATTKSFGDPVVIISVGMSADITLAENIAKKVGLNYSVYNAETTDLSKAASVIIVPGVSTKGLGAAGISLDDEIKATKGILDKLSDSTSVLVLHLGGSSRRDELTDQLIDVVLPAADHIMALADANKDNKFSDFATKNNVPSNIAAALPNIVTDLSALFGK